MTDGIKQLCLRFQKEKDDRLSSLIFQKLSDTITKHVNHFLRKLRFKECDIEDAFSCAMVGTMNFIWWVKEDTKINVLELHLRNRINKQLFKFFSQRMYKEIDVFSFLKSSEYNAVEVGEELKSVCAVDEINFEILHKHYVDMESKQEILNTSCFDKNKIFEYRKSKCRDRVYVDRFEKKLNQLLLCT